MATPTTRAEADSQSKRYYTAHFNKLKGRKIVDWQFIDVNTLVEDFMWDDSELYQAVVFILDDGTTFVPLRDPEGNGAGHLDIQTGATE